MPRGFPGERQRLEARILEALRAAPNGELGRTELRHALHLGNGGELDAATEALAKRRLITVEGVARYSRTGRGWAWRPIRLYRLIGNPKPVGPDEALAKAWNRDWKPQPGKPVPTVPVDELARRVLDALRAAGGTAQRNNLRNAIQPTMKLVDFDQAIAELERRGLVSAGRVTLAWKSPRGFELPYRVTVYRLRRGKGKRGS